MKKKKERLYDLYLAGQSSSLLLPAPSAPAATAFKNACISRGAAAAFFFLLKKLKKIFFSTFFFRFSVGAPSTPWEFFSLVFVLKF